MAGTRRRYDLEKLISESNIPVLQQLPDDINVNQLKWGLRSKLESLNAITEGQEIASVDNYPMIKEQIQRLESLLDQEILSLKNEMLKIYQLQAGQKSEWSMKEVEQQKKQEEREVQLTEELQNKWQGVLEKINDVPQTIEEQLQLQQSVFQEISGIISELAALRQDKEQREKKQEERESQLTKELQDKWQEVLGKIDAFPQGIEEQLQQSLFMQEISTIISELVVLQQDKEQGEKEQIAGKNMEWSVVEEIRHLMGEMKAHMLEESERQKKQEEREAQLTKELQNKWQDVLGKIDAFPQGIEEQLQQQSVFMQEISRIISELTVLQQDKEQGEREQTAGNNAEWNVAEEIRHLMDEMGFYMLEEAERQKKQEEREVQLTKELQDKWQDVLGKIDAFPQGIEEQLQQQSVFMQEISRIISELTVLQQDKEQGEREQTAGNNAEWNVAEEIRHLIDEMEFYMLEEAERQKKQEEREVQLTKELQDKWQDVLGKIDAFPQGIEEQLQLQQSIFMQEVSRIISELAVLRQDKEQREREQTVTGNTGWNAAEEVRHLIDEMGVHMLEEAERQKKQQEREEQLTKELQNKWQDVLGKIDGFPQGIEEQLLQQSVFMQEISRIISELTVLRQDKEQGEREKTAGKNAEWNVVEEIRHLMDEMEFYMLEEAERQKKQEEREAQLTKELQDKWQDVLGKIDAFPQGIEEQLQLQQSEFMQEVSGKIDAFPLAIEEQLQQQQSEFMQEVSGKIDAFPQAIEEQLQQQHSEFMQEVSGKIDAFPLAIEEQLQQQQSEFMQEVSGKIDAFPQAIEEQLQQQHSEFMQEVSGKIDAFPLAIEEQLQQQHSEFMQDVLGKLDAFPQGIEERLQLQQSVFMQEVSGKIDAFPLAIEEQLQQQHSEFMQDVLGKLDAFPQGIEERLQLQQSVFMQEVSGKIDTFPQAIEEQLQQQQSLIMQEVSRIISELAVLQQDKEQREKEQTVTGNMGWNVAEEIRHLMDEMKAHMFEEGEHVKQEEREAQLTKELQDKWQDVLGKLDAFPQGIEEQLQLQQSIFMQEISKIISELTVLQQDKERWEREERVGDNMEWNVEEEVRHLKDEMGAIRHMLEEVAEYSRRLTEISQQKDLISGEISLLKAELIALRKAQEQANEPIEQQHSIEESVVCVQMIKAQLQQQGNMLNHEILSLKEELAFIRELYENRLKRKKRRH
ncbi:hypothetical protein [Pelosinus baikalensis]|uniref:Uncharacterized protein n=1 Tax=Pelosinus baikalensis TaxID=2892015 RepID=A0ABS8HZR0_9FIRM|nr:hypothetical protein [Pelosinus baikalensis]MCC5468664.1 hypothetical protein [Pelosinus baikalensis]